MLTAIPFSFNRWQKCWTTPIQLWRSKACHSWERGQWKLCKKWYDLILSIKRGPWHTGGMCVTKKSRWDTCFYWKSWRSLTKSLCAASACEWLPWTPWCSRNFTSKLRCFSSVLVVESSDTKTRCFPPFPSTSLLSSYSTCYERSANAIKACR